MNATNEDSCFLTWLDSFVAKLKIFHIRVACLKRLESERPPKLLLSL